MWKSKKKYCFVWLFLIIIFRSINFKIWFKRRMYYHDVCVGFFNFVFIYRILARTIDHLIFFRLQIVICLNFSTFFLIILKRIDEKEEKKNCNIYWFKIDGYNILYPWKLFSTLPITRLFLNYYKLLPNGNSVYWTQRCTFNFYTLYTW